MKTLIELYDPSPIRNVLATLKFRPEEMILLCPSEILENQDLKRSLRELFAYVGCPARVSLVSVSLLDAEKIARVLRKILDSHRDCAIDISGGTDAALFASGAVSGDAPVFTYSKRKNTFFEIHNAPFARNVPCDVRLDTAACLLMAGGTLLPGRADNSILANMSGRIDRLFAIYSKYRRIWNRQISFIQRISSAEPGELTAEGPLTVKAGNKTARGDSAFFDELASAGMILNLEHLPEGIRFRFPDETVRFWLRDVGAVLELQVYHACLAAECFDDVVLSAVVNWQGGQIKGDSVTNEIDVMAVRGIQPVFISCKTCEIHTEALNELAILRDRFGGSSSRAILATSGITEKNRASVRNRAAKLGIELIEWNDIRLDKLIRRLRGES